MTQEEADRELGRIVRESLDKVLNRNADCEIDVVLNVAGYGTAMARIRVGHVGDIR